MSQSEKATYYGALKEAGVQFEKHYRDYTTGELKGIAESQGIAAPVEEPIVLEPVESTRASAEPMAAETAYSNTNEQPIRTDEHGRIWYREEVRKPATARPRARRLIKYVDSGAQEVRATQGGNFVESFEIAGSGTRVNEVKITLPSYQVGVFLDPRFPFKIHTYNGAQGFDLFDIQKYYGGSDLVPSEIKRVYVSNDLCYDIRTTIRAIQNEAREIQLKGTNR